MAQLTILGRVIEIAPYMIADMELAAPHIDAINSSVGSMTTLTGLTAMAGDFCAVLSVGLVKVDSTLTTEFLKANLGIGGLTALRAGFSDVLREGGMEQGEVPAPPPLEVAGALPTSSEPLSTT